MGDSVCKITNFEQRRLEKTGEYLTGEAFCLDCEHEWLAIAPVGTVSGLECPSCGTVKCIFRYGVVPEIVWTCNCGCQVFSISGISHNILCYRCGAVHDVG